MRAFTAVRRRLKASGPLDPQVLCNVIEQQHIPDFGFHQVLSAFYEPWDGNDFLIHATLRHRFSRQQHRQVMIARSYGDDGAQIFRVAREMWAKVYCRSDVLGMARPVGFLAEQKLFLQFLPDGPTLASLVQQRRESQLQHGIRLYARWLAKLHGSSRTLEAPAIRLDRDSLDALDAARETILRYRPDHAALTNGIANTLHGFLSHSRNPHIPTLGHHRLQDVVCREDSLSPIVFNKVALGDPAADIGGVIGQLYMTALKYYGTYEAAQPLVDLFQNEYRRHAHKSAPPRTEAYQAYTIMVQAADSLSKGGFDALRIGLWLDKAKSLL